MGTALPWLAQEPGRWRAQSRPDCLRAGRILVEGAPGAREREHRPVLCGSALVDVADADHPLVPRVELGIVVLELIAGAGHVESGALVLLRRVAHEPVVVSRDGHAMRAVELREVGVEGAPGALRHDTADAVALGLIVRQ